MNKDRILRRIIKEVFYRYPQIFADIGEFCQ